MTRLTQAIVSGLAAPALAVALSATGSSGAEAATVSGIVSSYYSASSGIIDRSEVFFPNSTPVIINGTVDLTNLVAGEAIMVGLINKPMADYMLDDSGDNYWENKDAWAHFTLTGSGQYRVGLGDTVETGGEIVQQWINLAGPETDFMLEIGLNMMTLTVGAQTVTKAYGTGHPSTYWTDPHDTWDPSSIDPEFVNGAYLLAGAFADEGGSAQVFATAAEVPLPAALPLFATGVAALGWIGRRKRRQAAAS